MKIYKLLFAILIIISSYDCISQTNNDFYTNYQQTRLSNADSTRKYYIDAYKEIEYMLTDKKPISFKQAVFITENAYLENRLSAQEFNTQIHTFIAICKAYIKTNKLKYSQSDSLNVAGNAVIFKFMTDTIWLTKDIPIHLPYSYDFNDYNGENDWSKMFVTKLIETGIGNCHSLPFLYKILAEEMNITAYLSIAPNHIYIKNYSNKAGWYNTELTNGMFPVDAWIAASGFVTLEAMQNSIYMDTLSLKQSIAVCLIDLAKGYERKYNTNANTFILQCCDLALKYYPSYINAILLKAECIKKEFDILMISKKAKYAKEILNEPKAKQLFETMEQLYASVLKSGYREMPVKMYKEWIVSLKENKEKYQNKEIMINFNQ